MKNFQILGIKKASINYRGGYMLLEFSFSERKWFSHKSVTKEVLINIVDNYNIKIVGGGNFTEKERQQIFVALAKSDIRE
jgi:hypothetical protein